MLCGARSAARALWRTLCGAHFVAHALWQTPCGALSAAHALWRALFGARYAAHALWRMICGARSMSRAVWHALCGACYTAHALWRTLCGVRSEARALWPRPVALTWCRTRFGHVAVLPVLAESVLQLSADGDRVAGPVGDFLGHVIRPVSMRGGPFCTGCVSYTLTNRFRSFLLGLAVL